MAEDDDSSTASHEGTREGDMFEPLNKRIRTLIVSDASFIVFLDEDCYVQWYEHKNIRYPEEYPTVMNRVAYLETVSTTHFRPWKSGGSKRELAEFRRLLGETVARVLDRNGTAAIEMVDRAEKILTDRSLQRARIWYLSAAGVTAALVLLAALLMWWWRDGARAAFGIAAFEVLICAAVGGAGAAISIITRIRDVSLNASAGPMLHYIEGFSRVAVGVLGAALVALAVKANLLVGAITNFESAEMRLACLGALCFVAGASERFVPNLIRKIETHQAHDEDRAAKAGKPGEQHATARRPSRRRKRQAPDDEA